MIPILVVTLIFLIRLQSQPVSGDVIEEETGAVNVPSITVTPTPIVPTTFAELMADLEADIQKVSDERVLLLIKQENALGYYSNLILIKRYDGKGLDASEFYRAALVFTTQRMFILV